MAKIIKVGSTNITPTKIANPFKTTRSTTTNPFKYQNFEGNTLQFADVFEGFQPKSANKLKLIASSVTGSMNKLKLSITEPIVAFVSRVTSGITGAWNYAKNTNVSDLPMIKTTTTKVSELGKNISDGIHSAKENMASKMAFLNTDVTDIGKAMAAKWTTLIEKYSGKKISADMSVSELETLWRHELEGVA